MGKKVLFVMALICCLVLSVAGTSFAGWMTGATVTSAASINGQVRLTLTKGTNTLMKYVNATYQKEVLAVALTAASSGATVDVYHDTASDRITMLIMNSVQ